MSTTLAPALDFPAIWAQAVPLPIFVAHSSPEHRPLWESIGRLHLPSEESLALDLPPGTRLLVLAADWCGDAVNVIPALDNWAAKKGIHLRVIERDEWPEVMDRYLTDGSRSIPIVILLDAEGHEIGHWGPRPTALQAWAMTHRDMEKGERYKQIRRWYAQDRGASTIREVVAAVRGEG